MPLSMQLNHILPNLKAARYLLPVILMWGVSACSNIPIPGIGSTENSNPQQSKQQSAATAPTQQQVISRFEQKIAEQLLSDLPEPSPTATLVDTEQYAAKLNFIIHESGLKVDLLNTEQRRILMTIADELAISQFRLQRWQQLNHLGSVANLQVELDQDKTYESLLTILSKQVTTGAAYPITFVNEAQNFVSKFSRPGGTSELTAAIAALSTNEQRWAQARLAFSLSETEQQAALGRLRTALDLQQAHLAELRTSLNLDERMYSDPYYDLQQETDPGQILLDLIVMHLEEALLMFSFREELAIEGSDNLPFSIYNYRHNQLWLNLPHVLELPAFEVQSLAYDMSGEVLAPSNWPDEWRGSAAIGISWWLHGQLQSAKLFRDEALYGSEVRRLLHLHLAIAELELSLGLITLPELEERLATRLPHNDTLRQKLMLDWFSSHRSYALGMLLAEDFARLSQPALIYLLGSQIPESYQMLRQQSVQELP